MNELDYSLPITLYTVYNICVCQLHIRGYNIVLSFNMSQVQLQTTSSLQDVIPYYVNKFTFSISMSTTSTPTTSTSTSIPTTSTLPPQLLVSHGDVTTKATVKIYNNYNRVDSLDMVIYYSMKSSALASAILLSIIIELATQL